MEADRAPAPPPSRQLEAAAPAIERLEPWKGGARAAYTLVHEDLVDASMGTLRVAVPALRTRGIRAGLATCVSLCSDASWTPLRTLAMEGFEIANHGWWHQAPTLENASQEIDEARKEIQRKVGGTVTFYACPDPSPDPEIVRYALEHGHLACRDGSNPGEVVMPGRVDPGRIPHDSFGQGSAFGEKAAQLGAFLDAVMDQGAWGVRSLRGVADSSWDPIPENIYVAHLDRLEKLIRAKELWVAPPTEILRHAMAFRDAGRPVIEGAMLRFPDAVADRKVRAFLSVVVRCRGKAPQRLVAEQHGAPVLARELEPGLWRLQVNPWDPVVLDAVQA